MKAHDSSHQHPLPGHQDSFTPPAAHLNSPAPVLDPLDPFTPFPAMDTPPFYKPTACQYRHFITTTITPRNGSPRGQGQRQQTMSRLEPSASGKLFFLYILV